MKNGFKISVRLSAPPEQVYRAWLSGREHSAMTGGKASVKARIGGRHTAWNGHIRGKNLKLKRNRRIVQTWRTREFPKNAPDSRIEVRIARASKGSKLTLIHTRLTPKQVRQYSSGWRTHYFKPMRKYFSAKTPAKRRSRGSTRRR
jgi:uncharacterized protein YndB with AHSA1/START domain